MKAPLGPFLRRNPFPDPYTLGFFYREKMRAIHRIAPERGIDVVLEIGGGPSGLTSLLYPRARVVNLDLDPSYGVALPNLRERVRFLAGDATALPLADGRLDAVTMFDLIEHVPDDRAAMAEAWRVLRPGGVLLLSTPESRWRYPFYGFMRPVCPPEEALWEEWGHVRRGYALRELEELLGRPCSAWSTFINPVTALAHDVSFSRLPRRLRRALCAVLLPITWGAFVLHPPHARGTELAVRWDKPA